MAGGTIAGIISQRLGRRLTMMSFILLIGCFIPLWIIPSGFSSLAAGAFCVQFGVQGAWGVIPIHLAEMSPPAFRATFPGLMYQMGNMVSSASSQIEASESLALSSLPSLFFSLRRLQFLSHSIFHKRANTVAPSFLLGSFHFFDRSDN